MEQKNCQDEPIYENTRHKLHLKKAIVAIIDNDLNDSEETSTLNKYFGIEEFNEFAGNEKAVEVCDKCADYEQQIQKQNDDIEKFVQDKQEYKQYIDCLNKEKTELKSAVECLQNKIDSICDERNATILILEKERIHSKSLKLQLSMKTQQNVTLEIELNDSSKLLDEEQNRNEVLKCELNECQEKLVDVSRLQADIAMLYKSLEIERKEREMSEVSLQKENEILKEKLEKAQQDILDQQIQMSTINKISEESCAKYIRNCSLSDRSNIEKEFARAQVLEEQIINETANILSRYVFKKDSVKTMIDRFENHKFTQQGPHCEQACEDRFVNTHNEGSSCSHISNIENFGNETANIESQGCHKIGLISPQKQISQTIVQADKVFYINSAVSNHIAESDARAIEELSLSITGSDAKSTEETPVNIDESNARTTGEPPLNI